MGSAKSQTQLSDFSLFIHTSGIRLSLSIRVIQELRLPDLTPYWARISVRQSTGLTNSQVTLIHPKLGRLGTPAPGDSFITLRHKTTIKDYLIKGGRRGFPGGSDGQDLSLTLGWEEPLEEGVEIHVSILAWKIPMDRGAWGVQSMGSQRARHSWVTKHSSTRTRRDTHNTHSARSKTLETLTDYLESPLLVQPSTTDPGPNPHRYWTRQASLYEKLKGTIHGLGNWPFSGLW